MFSEEMEPIYYEMEDKKVLATLFTFYFFVYLFIYIYAKYFMN